MPVADPFEHPDAQRRFRVMKNIEELQLPSITRGSLRMKGKQPYWPDNLMKRYIRPVAHKAGITKNIGWHTFRHSFGTLPKANGEDMKTVQELLRHANSRITFDVYTQAVNSHERAAQSKVVRMMVPNVGQREVETDSLLVHRRA